MPSDHEDNTERFQREQGEAGLELKGEVRWAEPAGDPTAAPVLEQRFFEKYTGKYVWRPVPIVKREAGRDG